MMASGMSSIEEIARRARAASLALQDVSTEKKNAALAATKALLAQRRVQIIEANEKDMEVWCIAKDAFVHAQHNRSL